MDDVTETSIHLQSSAIFELLTREDEAKLLALILVANLREHRRRFGGARSEASIRDHCHKINWDDHLAVGAFIGRRLDAVIEFYPIASNWDRAELGPLAMPNFPTFLARELAARAVLEARRQGCSELVWISPDPNDPWLGALREVGAFHAQGNDILIRL